MEKKAYHCRQQNEVEVVRRYGGEGGIRTPGRSFPLRRFSKPLLSTTQPPLREMHMVLRGILPHYNTFFVLLACTGLTTQAGLEPHLLRRRGYTPLDDHVFVSLRRRPLLLHDAETAFHDIAEKISLPRGAGLPRPTIHSLRHTFAVRALETCPDGRDRITKHMLALSTYLGHSK